MQVAALSASSATAAADFDRAVSAAAGLIGAETPGRAAFFRRLGTIIAARQNGAEITRVIDRVSNRSVERRKGPFDSPLTLSQSKGERLAQDRLEPDHASDWWRVATLEGLAGGARARGVNPAVWRRSQLVLLRLFEQSPSAVGHGALELLKVAGPPASPASDEALAHAVATATDRSADPARRADAIDLLTLRRDRLTAIGERLRLLVDASEPDNVRAAAARALGRIGGDELAAFLLSKWRSFTPEVRHAAADALLRETAPTRALLSSLKRGDVQPWTLDFREKRRLLMHRDAAIRDEARAILEEKPGERDAVLKRFDRALDLDGDLARGEQVFKRVCEKCHRMNGAGADVGPDLGTVRNRLPSVLLADILLPNRSIAPGYEAYAVDRISGGVESGVLRTYSPDAIVLRREEGQETIIPRQDIRQMTLLTLSLMPADLDAQLDPQQMADLIAFVRAGR
jgi:putative heme-binding domain-containing protein